MAGSGLRTRRGAAFDRNSVGHPFAARSSRAEGERHPFLCAVLKLIAGGMCMAGLPDLHQRPEFPGVFIHESAYVDLPTRIGEGHAHLALRARAQRLRHRPRLHAWPKRDDRPGRPHRRRLQDPEQCRRCTTVLSWLMACSAAPVASSPTSTIRAQRSSEKRGSAPTLVKRGATIGANATIVCGHSWASIVLLPPVPS